MFQKGSLTMKKTTNKVYDIVSKISVWLLTAVLTFLTALTVYVLVCSSRGKTADLFGTVVMKVITGSMEPSIHEGDYIIIKKTDVSSLKEGDIICFYSLDEAIYNIPNTHRITGITDNGEFITKGDACTSEDSARVPADRIIGKYSGKSRFLRWINSFVSVKKLLLIFTFLPLLTITICEAVTVARLGMKCLSEKEELISQERERLFREAVEREKKRLAETGLPSDAVSSDEINAQKKNEGN